MPIQIRELIVTATVEEGRAASPQPASADAPSAQNTPSHDAIVQECVDQVLRVLKQQGRR